MGRRGEPNRSEPAVEPMNRPVLVAAACLLFAAVTGTLLATAPVAGAVGPSVPAPDAGSGEVASAAGQPPSVDAEPVRSVTDDVVERSRPAPATTRAGPAGENGTVFVVVLNDTDAYRSLAGSNLSYAEKSSRFQETPFYGSAVEQLTRHGSLSDPPGRAGESGANDPGSYVFFLNAVLLEADASEESRIAALPFVEEVWNGSRRVPVEPSSATREVFGPETAAVASGETTAEEYWEGVTDDNWGYEETGLREYHEQIAPNDRGEGLSVTVIDSGFDVDHPLYNPMWKGESFEDYHVNVAGAHYYCKGVAYEGDSYCLSDRIDDSHPRGHGTKDLGVVWQAVPNAYFHVAELPVPSSALGMLYWDGITAEQIIASFEYGKQVDSDVITTSVGLADECSQPNDGSMNVSQVASEAADEDTVVVAATGNAGCSYPVPPATGDGVVAVSGTRIDQHDPVRQEVDFGSRPSQTHDGKPNLAAPGEEVSSLAPGGTASELNGSSFAAPHVAGIAALLSWHGDAPTVRDALYSSAIDRSGAFDGHGRASMLGAYGDENLTGTGSHPDPTTEVVDSTVSAGVAQFKVRLDNRGEVSYTDANGVSFRLSGATFRSLSLGGFDRCLVADDVSVSGCQQRPDVPSGVVELYVDGDEATSGVVEADLTDPENAKVAHRGWIRDQFDTTFNPHSWAYERYVARSPGEDGEVDVKEPRVQGVDNPPYARASHDDGFDVTQYPTTETAIGPSATTLSASPETWDVGDLSAGATRTKTFSVENTGGVGTDVSVSGGSGLSISGAPGHLDAGESASFSVTLDADDYDGDSVVVSYAGGEEVIPVSATVVADEEYLEDDTEWLSDESSCYLAIDVWGDGHTAYCPDEPYREWSDDAYLDDEAMAGFQSATLDVEFRTDSHDDKQPDPLEVYVNGDHVTDLESPPGGGVWETRSVPVAESDLQEGDNEIRLKTSGSSSYDIGGDTELQYTYLEEPDLRLTIGEYPSEVEPGTTIRVPVTVENDGGRTANNVVLGTSGSDSDVIEVTRWPDGYGLHDSESLEPGQSDVRYFEFRYEQATTTSVEIAAVSDADDTDRSFTVSPPNDPPTLSTHGVTPEEAHAGDEVTYTASVADLDGDGVDVTLEVYDPSAGTWRTEATRQVSGTGTVSFDRTPFDADDEGSESRFRLAYDDGNGHSGTWGPFSGPTVVDDDTAGPTFDDWAYPTSVEPGESVDVSVGVSDSSGVTDATLTYTYPDGTEGSAAMAKSGSTWTATVPASDESHAGGSIAFAVSATDGDESPSASESATRQVSVAAGNDPPSASLVAEPAEIAPGETVRLNASGSTDPDGDALTYDWEYVDGPVEDLPTSLDGPTAELALDEEGHYTVAVTVSDGNATDRATAVVEVDAPGDADVEHRDVTGDGLDDLVVENDDVTLRLDGADLASTRFVSVVRRGGETYATGFRWNPTDPDGNRPSFESTEAVETFEEGDRAGFRVVRRYDLAGTPIRTTYVVSLDADATGAVVEANWTNLGSSSVTLDQKEAHVHDGVMLVKGVELESRAGSYRFHVRSGGTHGFENVSNWQRFGMAGENPFVTVFDDEKAVTYGLRDGTTGPRPAVTNGGSPPTAVDFMIQEVALAADETATYEFVVAAHDGGSGAPDRAAAILDQGTNQPPEATLTANASSATVGESIRLDAGNSSDPGDDLTYDWTVVSGPENASVDLPDGPSGQVAFPTAGTYTVAVTVSDGEADDEATVTVEVTDDEDPPEASPAPVVESVTPALGTETYVNDTATVSAVVNATPGAPAQSVLLVTSEFTTFAASYPHADTTTPNATVRADDLAGDGNHSVTAVAVEDGESVAMSGGRLVVDTDPPAVSVAVDADLANDTANVTVRADEPLADAPSVTVEYPDGSTESVSVVREDDRYVGTFPPNGTGQYFVRATGEDRAGNVGTTNASTVLAAVSIRDGSGSVENDGTGTNVTFNASTDGTANVSISESDAPPAPMPDGDLGLHFVSTELSADLAAALENATIAIPVAEYPLPEGLSPTNVSLVHYDGTNGSYEPVPTQVVTATEDGDSRDYYVATVEEFSTYGAVATDTADPEITRTDLPESADHTLAFEYADDQSGVDASAVEVLVDGTPVTDDADHTAITTDRATHDASSLSAGNHTATIRVVDHAGNVANETVEFSLGGGSGGGDGEDGGGSGGSGGGSVPPPSLLTETTALADDGVEVAVRNGLAGRTAQLHFDGVPAGDATFDRLRVAFAYDLQEFAFALHPSVGVPDGTPELGTAEALGYLAVDRDVRNGYFESVELRFEVPEGALPEGATLGDVALYRADGGSWSRVETSRQGSTFEATADGFDTFAVGVEVETTGEPTTSGATATTDGASNERPTTSPPTTPADGQPGLGHVVGLLALLAAVLLGRYS